MSVLIKGGRIVTAADDYVADIYVEDETVTLIGESLDQPANKVIERERQVRASGGWSTRTRTSTCPSAARSRSTTSSRARPRRPSADDVPRRLHHPAAGRDVRRRARRVAREGRRQAGDRHGLPHGGHRPERGGTLEELATLPDEGVTSYKLFMAYKGALHGRRRDALPTMEVAAETGALVMVHAENGDAIDVLVKRRSPRATPSRTTTRSRGRPRPRARRRTARSSSRASPAAPLYVVHVTCRRRSSRSAAPRPRLDVWGESCTQYFFRSIDDLAQPDFEGAKYVYSPPRATPRTTTSLGRRTHRCALRDLDRPLRVPVRRAEDAR
jgi:dihydropyrimidinase